MIRPFFLAACFLTGACGAGTPTDSGSVAPPADGPVGDFIWVGVFGEDRQFTDAEFRTLVSDYDFVVIAAFHCGGRRACHEEAARRLKELDPEITVLAYMNSFIREFPGTNRLELFGQETWSDDWWLRHADTDEIVEVGGGRGGFKDLTKPALRSWMIGIVRGWLDQAPFDGVAYDRLQGIPADNEIWLERIGASKIAAINQAMVDLVRETKDALGDSGFVVYNGFKDAQASFTGRLFTAALPAADGIANEYFCYHKDRGFEVPPGQSLEEIVIRDVEAHAGTAAMGKAVLAHVSYQTNDLTRQEKDRINRLCYGSFLLGHRPGYTSYKFGFLNTQRLLDENAAEQGLDFGAPEGAKAALGSGVYLREFEYGSVVVNLRPGSSAYTTSSPVVLMNGGVEGPAFGAGEEIEVPGTDALFLIRR